jgi:hypothetical protein
MVMILIAMITTMTTLRTRLTTPSALMTCGTRCDLVSELGFGLGLPHMLAGVYAQRTGGRVGVASHTQGTWMRS